MAGAGPGRAWPSCRPGGAGRRRRGLRPAPTSWWWGRPGCPRPASWRPPGARRRRPPDRLGRQHAQRRHGDPRAHVGAGRPREVPRPAGPPPLRRGERGVRPRRGAGGRSLAPDRLRLRASAAVPPTPSGWCPRWRRWRARRRAGRAGTVRPRPELGAEVDRTPTTAAWCSSAPADCTRPASTAAWWPRAAGATVVGGRARAVDRPRAGDGAGHRVTATPTPRSPSRRARSSCAPTPTPTTRSLSCSAGAAGRQLHHRHRGARRRAGPVRQPPRADAGRQQELPLLLAADPDRRVLFGGRRSLAPSSLAQACSSSTRWWPSTRSSPWRWPGRGAATWRSRSTGCHTRAGSTVPGTPRGATARAWRSTRGWACASAATSPAAARPGVRRAAPPPHPPAPLAPGLPLGGRRPDALARRGFRP